MEEQHRTEGDLQQVEKPMAEEDWLHQQAHKLKVE